MLRFWRNPEFVRYVRAELRAPRAITAALLVVLISVLVGLSCWGAKRPNLHAFFRAFHQSLVYIQYTLLAVWCAIACGQSITRERELKTYDFLRTTRLSATELMVGKLLGVPVMAYFVVLCSLPASFTLGILAGMPLGRLLRVYFLLLVFALFVSFMGLWVSMLVEGSNRGVSGLLGLLPVTMFVSYAYTAFPGAGALSIFPAIQSLEGTDSTIAKIRPTLLGLPVSWTAATTLLYTLFGAWLVLMLVRNLKKEREQICLLSRWQAVCFVAFLNVIYYVLLNPDQILVSKMRFSYGTVTPEEVSDMAVGLNAAALFATALATLSPREKLKAWWRKRASGGERYFSENGLTWPWLFPAAAIAYGLLVVEAGGLGRRIPIAEWHLGTTAVQLLVLLAFAVRDILFLQWCTLTRMKRPLISGVLYLGLYYLTVGIVGGVVGLASREVAKYIHSLAAYYVLAGRQIGVRVSPEVFFGLALQLPLIFLLLTAITRRLSRPAVLPAASSG